MAYKVTIKYTRENESVNFYELSTELETNTESYYTELLNTGKLLSLNRTVIGNVYEIIQLWADQSSAINYYNNSVTEERLEAIHNYNLKHNISKTVIIESS